MAGDIVKRIYVPIKVQGAEEAKAQMAEIAIEADKLNDGVNIKIKVDQDGINRIDSLFTRIKNLFGGTTNLPGPIPPLPTPVVIAGIAAALAALPFLAQAAAGAITLGLGGALVALGVYAEKGTRSVQYQFSQLVSGKDGIAATLKNISPAFGQALTTILSAARTFVPQFIRDFGPALNAIAGPLKQIGVMLAGTLASPQIATAIKTTGQAFGSILTALTPQLPGDINMLANGFTNVANAIKKNPKPIADLISGLIRLGAIILDVIAWLTQVADYIEQHWIPAWHRTERFLDKWRHDVAHTWETLYHDALTWFDRIKTDVARIWDQTWQNTVVRVQHGITETVAWFKGMPGRIVRGLGDLKNLLVGAGKDTMNGFLNGLKSAWGSVTSFISGIAGWIKSHKGPIEVDAILLRPHGQAIMQGLVAGLADGMPALNAQLARTTMLIGSPGYGYGAPGGVLRLEVIGGGGGMLDRLFISWLKNYVRVAGGGGPQSVQRALGQVWR